MNRARHPAPFALRTIKHDPVKSLYSITENEVTFSMGFEDTMHLKGYFRAAGEKTIINWYKGLPKESKARIQAVGLPAEADKYFPDLEYPD